MMELALGNNPVKPKKDFSGVKLSEDKPKGIIVQKFMLTIEQYPNGRIFPKIFPIGQTRKAFSNRNNKKKRKAVTEVKMADDEVY